jgi:hypothetical protein
MSALCPHGLGPDDCDDCIDAAVDRYEAQLADKLEDAERRIDAALEEDDR